MTPSFPTPSHLLNPQESRSLSPEGEDSLLEMLVPVVSAQGLPLLAARGMSVPGILLGQGETW